MQIDVQRLKYAQPRMLTASLTLAEENISDHSILCLAEAHYVFLDTGFQSYKCFLVLFCCQETSKHLVKASLLYKLSMLLLLESFVSFLRSILP